MKWASYRRFAQASRRFRQTDLEERLDCVVNANRSSGGKVFVISKISIAFANAFWYTTRSFADLANTVPLLTSDF